MITQQRLKDVLVYNKDKGTFRWRQTLCNRAKAGGYAGCVHRTTGYRYIMVDGVSYRAHRLAWLYVHGEFPENQIDHINGIRDDNRITNLRDVDRRANCQNQTTHRNGKLVGCYYHKPSGKWLAQIRIGKKKQSLGLYDTEEEGHEAYVEALKELECYR